MSSYGSEAIGDNIEFTAVNIGDYTIWLSMGGTDTEFMKYPNNPKSARKFQIRTDKSTDLLGLDNLTFTNPCQITIDKPHIETRNVARIAKMKIRTTETNTMIKVRWF